MNHRDPDHPEGPDERGAATDAAPGAGDDAPTADSLADDSLADADLTDDASDAPLARELSIPDLCLVVLVGVSGAGKSTFAREHFRDTEVISSDRCRALVADDENALDANADAFAILNAIAEEADDGSHECGQVTCWIRNPDRWQTGL